MEQKAHLPPQDLDAELAVLGSIIADNKVAVTAYELLREEDFYSPAHGKIFYAMMGLFTASIPIDIITLSNKLKEEGIFERIGAMEIITQVSTYMSTGVQIEHYAKIVADKAIQRRLIHVAGDIRSRSFEGEKVDTLLEFAEKSIFDISKNRQTSDFAHIQDVLIDTLETIEKNYLSTDRITGVKTGFMDLDEKTAGLQPSDLILLAGRPSMGKTALALNIACQAAFYDQIPTAIFSLEMSKEQIVSRMLCSEALVDSQRIRTGRLQDEDWGKIVETIGLLSKGNMYIDDTPGISVGELRAKCRKLQMEKGLGLVVIDYLQLMSGSGRNDSRQQEVSDISRSLKGLARELEVPVVLLSQLSRAVEGRVDKRPILSDLRDSGAIEQDADLVSFIYRDEYYHPDTERRGIAEVIVAKQRNGPTGTVELGYQGQFTRFVSLEKNY